MSLLDSFPVAGTILSGETTTRNPTPSRTLPSVAIDAIKALDDLALAHVNVLKDLANMETQASVDAERLQAELKELDQELEVTSANIKVAEDLLGQKEKELEVAKAQRASNHKCSPHRGSDFFQWMKSVTTMPSPMLSWRNCRER